MFDIGWSELLVIAVVAIVVVGPKDLPRLMRTFGHYMGKVRGMASDFQRQFEEAVRDSELDEVRKAMHEVRTTATSATAAIDRPLMTPQPKPASPPPPASEAQAAETAAEIAKKSPPKPRVKRTAAKDKTLAPETTAAKTGAAKTAAAEAPTPKTAPKPRKPREPKEPAP